MLFALLVCCMFIGQIMSRIVLLSYFDEIPEDLTQYPFLLITMMMIGQICTHILAFVGFVRITRLKFRDFLSFPKTNLLLIISLPLIASALILLMDVLSNFSFFYFENAGMYAIIEAETERQKLTTQLFDHNHYGQYFYSIIVFAVLPAIGEELIYRGILFTRIFAATEKLHFSVFISSGIFAAVHMQPVNLLPLLISGIVLNYLYHFTKNIWLNIFLHFLVNGIQISVLFFSGSTL